ncbi:FANCI solenoid 4-domain-containing protein [Halteromyces radiatus]|uniref:FANCI solenoid 4-domain-containing protein n=1 Tax=Halteromyces radiatus TaxID=101107 RepID=UPI002220B9AC|nr:FANCI solenoid 4-domain-containing protein [Halteromyces radiatus]KAI8086670.1 FANCI solenoid 4-domain-containing protein [Halteromyces radiatus]
MDHTILKLAKQTNRTALKEYVASLTSDQIETLLKNKFSQSTHAGIDPILVIRGLLLGDPNGMQTRLVITKTIIDWLGTETESTNGSGTKVKLATTAINLLLPEIEIFTPGMIEEIAQQIIQLIENNVPVQPRIFEILGKSYNLLSAMEANDRTKTILNQICDSNWHPNSTVGLASCMNEMELATPQLNQVIKRMLLQLKELETEEVPPFIYQLLLLSRKGNKREILAGICQFFDWLHNSPIQDDTSRMEGTVMLHISFAIKQDQELGMELVKYIKSDKALLLEKFKMACLLSAARIHRLEEIIFDLLKTTVISIYKDSDKFDKSSWIIEYANIDTCALRKVLLDIADKSASGWDQVIQSLTQLAMVLIDGATNPTPLKAPGTIVRSKRPKPGPLDEVISLGIDILLKMFKLHDITRAEILEQITSRVVSRSSSSMHFLDLLETLTTNCPYEIEKYISNIKDTLDYLSFLSHPTAKRLLTAIQPVSCGNYQFRDGLILVLRKSMFARELDSRMIAVNGFLSLLQNQLDTTKQTSSSRIEATEGVAFEILGLLRRCFSQQCEVRAEAYDGLGALSIQCESLSGDIFEILYAQFLHYFETDNGVVTPLQLSSCVESNVKSRLLEPIHLLLANLLKTVRNLKNGKHHSVITSALTSCKEHIKSLTFRLTKLDTEDYELDKATNFDTTTSTGLRYYYFAELLLGTLDTVMEYEFITQGDTVESCQVIITLFKKRKTLLTLIKENSSKDKGRKLSSLGTSSLLSLEFTAKITKALFLQGDRQSPILMLRSDIDFLHYIVSITPIVLATTVDNEKIRQDNIYFEYCVDLAKVYTHILIHEDSDSSFINHQPKKGQSLLASVTASLKYILDLTYNLWPDRLPTLLSQLQSMSNVEHPSEKVNTVITDLLNQFKEILDKHLNAQTPLYKESAYVIQVISFLANQLDRTEDDFADHSNRVIQWLTKLAQDRPIEDTGVAKEIMTLLIQLSADSNQLDVIKAMAEDIHALQGEVEINEDSQADVTLTYPLINAKTHGVITALLLSFTDQSNDSMIWCIGRLKISAMSNDIDQHSEFEKMICDRLASYVDIVSELTRAALVGSHAETLIKVLTKTYRTFTAFVKYKMTNLKIELSQNVIQLIANVGSKVTDKMYKFLTMYAHHRQEEYEFSGTKKGKKKEINAREKAKILREAKTIPGLIFVVEQFERHLIQLTRKSKVDLMQYMKRSTSRDFQIKLDKYVESSSDDDDKNPKRPRVEPYDEEEEDDQILDSESDQETSSGPRKRTRQ